MKTIEEKAKQRAFDIPLSLGLNIPELIVAIHNVYIEAATEALAGQWQSVDNPPQHSRTVFVLIDDGDSGLRYTTAYYHRDGVWDFPDDWYYGCKVLKWMEPPKDDSE